ncbi:ribonuclease H-like domain-containing protein [Haloplanus salilacus]|uniref:ribonuclease H-like domain-containing protein n=1 Tax=Haloplanus salilacus TaxID=2949994 RepID=UPI0030CC93B5
MTTTDRLDLLVYSASALARLTHEQFTDSVRFVDPDLIVATEPQHEHRLRRIAPTDCPIATVGGYTTDRVQTQTNGSVGVVVIDDIDGLSSLPESLRDGSLTDGGELYLLSDLLTIEIDLTHLETRLEGREAYIDALQPASLGGSYTHLTTNANPSYRSEWGDLLVHGVMPGANVRQGQQGDAMAHLKLHADGVVSTRTFAPDAFGIRALPQVGRSRAETLREAGYDSRTDVASADITELQELPGFGRSTAKRVVDGATATVEGEVRRFSDDGFPHADPVFVDIETDGLSPTVVWMIGVLDRAGSESYLSFVARDPDTPGEAVTGFMSWLTENVTNRPIVAYNGYGFDFPVLEEHIERHCPQYLDAWRELWLFDPYRWATDEGNAVLPGRTNKLEDVASTLGWDSDETGLSGASVARLFQRWQSNPCDATELDWNRHRRYCEDDVRALAHVFDAIADASRTDTGVDTREGYSSSTTSTQGTLGDFRR